MHGFNASWSLVYHLHNIMACRLAKWVAFLHKAVMATVVMCRVRNPACTATSALGKERYING